jgi:uncharacterized protein (TIGR03083 family)
MEEIIPINVSHLFAILDAHLIDLLRSLANDEWANPTLAKQWTIKDVAAHLLDGNLRTLSLQRDKYFGLAAPQGTQSYAELVHWLDSINHEWVQAAKRISPDVLIFLLEATGAPTSAYFASVNPWADAPFPVDWAGETKSFQWMHVAREYTEKWHHQQQIRDAVGQTEVLMTRELFYPCIDTFMRGLPLTYTSIEAPAGTSVQVEVTGEAGGAWYLERGQNGWALSQNHASNPVTRVVIPPDVAWKVFTKGISYEKARERTEITGDIALGEHALTMVSVMAQKR